jgi:predicted nucleic acid-binding protein
VALIVDTGPLVAMLNPSDPEHERCAALLANARERRVVPVSVLVEVEYLLRPAQGAFSGLLSDFASGGFAVLELPVRWVVRAGELLERYRDLPLGFVDASVLAATEMLGESKVATLDHRHFGVVRPAHVSSLTLLP